MLTGCGRTPHPHAWMPSYEDLMNRPMRTKLHHQLKESNHENARDVIVNWKRLRVQRENQTECSQREL